MMQPSARCAICDADNDVMQLCSLHHWQAVMRRLVENGLVSDWEPLATGKHTAPVKHRTMLMTPCAPPLSWRASVLALCNSVSVWWDDGTGDEMESYGDWLADNWLIDFGTTDDGRQAA